MKKRLLIIVDTIKPMVDGVSSFLDGILPYLIKRYEVTVIAPYYGEVAYPTVKLIQFPVFKLSFSDYGIPKIIRKIVKKEVKKCDLIFNNESISPYFIPSLFALHYAKKYKKPFFTYVHSIDWELFPETLHIPQFIRSFGKYFLKIYGRWFLSNRSIILVSFPKIAQILKENKVEGRFEIAPIGISDIFYTGKSKFSFADKVVLGFVGRVSREKGMEILLDTFLALRYKFKNLLLLIVGDGPDKGIFKNKDNVRVTGFVSPEDVAEYYRSMDIFLLPSFTEANSLSTLEALKSGVCCVIRNVGAISDYIKSDYNGYLFNDEQELIEILEKLIKDEKLRKKIGDNASKSVLQYTWENTVNGLIQVFEKYS